MQSNETMELLGLIRHFQQSMRSHLPLLEKEVNDLITRREQQPKVIEHLLDTLISLWSMSIGKEVFTRLLDYYQGIHPAHATAYKRYVEKIYG